MPISGNKNKKAVTTPGIFVRGLTVPKSCRECSFRHGEQCWAVAEDQWNLIEPRDLMGDLRAPFCPIEEVSCRSQLFWHDANVEKPDDDRVVMIVCDREYRPFLARFKAGYWEDLIDPDYDYFERRIPALMWADLPENPLKG